MLRWVSTLILACLSGLIDADIVHAQGESSRQDLMKQARRVAADGQEFNMNSTAGTFVFYNNPRPFCYTYMIPGEWVSSLEENAWRSKDGRQFAGVFFVRSQSLKDFKGDTLVERGGARISRDYEKTLGQPLTGVKLAPFYSMFQGTWKWTAAPVNKGNRRIALPMRIIADFSPDGIAVIAIEGTADDDGLARRIIATLKATKDPQCYFSVLDDMLKAVTGESASSETTAPARVDSTAPTRVYTQPTYRWSVSYPAEWKVDGADPSNVRIYSPAGDGLCGLHRATVPLKTVEEFADSFETQDEREHFTVKHSPKQRISLPNDVIGIDVVREIRGGGRSRRIYMLADGVAYNIDCETDVSNWDKLAPFFGRIISSFTLEKKP